MSFRALQGAKEAGQIVNNINPPLTECWHPANKWLKYNYRFKPVGLHYTQDKIQLENKIYIYINEGKIEMCAWVAIYFLKVPTNSKVSQICFLY